MANVFLGLGSNLGNRPANLQKACSAIKALDDVSWLTLSKIYETEPVGPAKQGKFLNAAAKVQTSIKPIALRRKLAEIETALGRADKNKRIHWGPRTIDIDVLFYENKIIKHKELIVPHPEIVKRWFVLKPLADLAPDFVHPVIGKSIKQLLEQLS